MPRSSDTRAAEARAGARTYVIYLLGAAKLLLLAAVILTYNVAGTLEFRRRRHCPPRNWPPAHLLFILFVLFLFGFAKNAVMPLHSWLPAAMVAPTASERAAARRGRRQDRRFRHAAGFLFVFGPEAMRQLGADQLALGVASVTILGGSLLALGQDNLKLRLAFSTVSQLSYIVLGGALLTTSGVLGGIVHITNRLLEDHALSLRRLDLRVRTQDRGQSDVGTRAADALDDGRVRGRVLSLVGLPPASGFISSSALALGSLEHGSTWVLGVLLASSLLSAAYLGPVVSAGLLRRGARRRAAHGA